MMSEKERRVFLLMSIALCCSCGNNSSSTYNGGSEETVSYDESLLEEDGKGGPEEVFEEDTHKIGDNENYNFQLTGIIEECRHCHGYGMVQDGLNSPAYYCKFCGGQRMVDAAINQLPDDFFDRFEEYHGDETYSGSMDKWQIMQELNQRYENLRQMLLQLEYIEGDVNRNYLEQQIIEEKYEIKRLQRLLNGQ